jgi:hypothetical protein
MTPAGERIRQVAASLKQRPETHSELLRRLAHWPETLLEEDLERLDICERKRLAFQVDRARQFIALRERGAA